MVRITGTSGPMHITEELAHIRCRSVGVDRTHGTRERIAHRGCVRPRDGAADRTHLTCGDRRVDILVRRHSPACEAATVSVARIQRVDDAFHVHTGCYQTSVLGIRELGAPRCEPILLTRRVDVEELDTGRKSGLALPRRPLLEPPDLRQPFIEVALQEADGLTAGTTQPDEQHPSITHLSSSTT